jgi:hypothetical protein
MCIYSDVVPTPERTRGPVPGQTLIAYIPAACTDGFVGFHVAGCLIEFLERNAASGWITVKELTLA